MRIFLLFLLVSIVYAYQRGDVVDVELEGVDLMTSESPRFGVKSKAVIPRDYIERVSLTFQDGLWGLPVYYLKHYGKHLNQIDVTFVYSQGQINALESDAKYEPTENDNIHIQYNWIKEPEVQLQAGMFVTMLAVLLVSLVILISACDQAEKSSSPTHSHQTKYT